MRISIVDNPIKKYPECDGAYFSSNDIILIKKNVTSKRFLEIFFHEFGHYLINKCFNFINKQHKLDLYYDIICVILFSNIKLISRKIKWYRKYYNENCIK